MAAKILDEGGLYESALNHLARYAATEASLKRVLARKIERAAGEEGGDAARLAQARIPAVIARLRAAGALDDAAFAASRAQRLVRAGKSARAVAAHLAAKGVMGMAPPQDPARELAAACAYLRRRRAGPFGDAPEPKIMAAMARGGFSQTIARRAWAMDREAAEAAIKSLEDW